MSDDRNSFCRERIPETINIMPNYIVRYGVMRLMGVFDSPQNQVLLREADVIVRTSRGMEAGTVLSDATEDRVSQLRSPDTGSIMREMTEDDRRDVKRIHQQEADEFKRCDSIIKRMNLQMDLVMVEHIFGGERIVVYYLADGRVDFRELVKVLASEFQTRIEMRQIGVRDEAKLLADYGDCGKAVCCNTHLIQMPPVSMKMAKLQKATLDPTKISGRCGRLKCCLRYEYDTYIELTSLLPSPGARVNTPDGKGVVIGQVILNESLQVELEGGKIKQFKFTELEMLSRDRSGGGREREYDNRNRENDADQSSQKESPGSDTSADEAMKPNQDAE